PRHRVPGRRLRLVLDYRQPRLPGTVPLADLRMVKGQTPRGRRPLPVPQRGQLCRWLQRSELLLPGTGLVAYWWGAEAYQAQIPLALLAGYEAWFPRPGCGGTPAAVAPEGLRSAGD